MLDLYLFMTILYVYRYYLSILNILLFLLIKTTLYVRQLKYFSFMLRNSCIPIQIRSWPKYVYNMLEVFFISRIVWIFEIINILFRLYITNHTIYAYKEQCTWGNTLMFHPILGFVLQIKLITQPFKIVQTTDTLL